MNIESIKKRPPCDLNSIHGCDSAEVVHLTVIKTVANKGEGTESDPRMKVAQFWDFEGNFLFETTDTTKY